jgi:hypothetical protein
MSPIMKRAGLLAAAFLVVGSSARADVVEIRVPFSFVVRGQTLPAGEYRIEREGSAMLLRGEKGNNAAVFFSMIPAAGHDPAGEKPAVIFAPYEKMHRLAGFWESGTEGYEIHGS